MYDVHIEVESLVYIYVYVGSRTIFFPVVMKTLLSFKFKNVLKAYCQYQTVIII